MVAFLIVTNCSAFFTDFNQWRLLGGLWTGALPSGLVFIVQSRKHKSAGLKFCVFFVLIKNGSWSVETSFCFLWLHIVLHCVVLVGNLSLALCFEGYTDGLKSLGETLASFCYAIWQSLDKSITEENLHWTTPPEWHETFWLVHLPPK